MNTRDPRAMPGVTSPNPTLDQLKDVGRVLFARATEQVRVECERRAQQYFGPGELRAAYQEGVADALSLAVDAMLPPGPRQ